MFAPKGLRHMAAPADWQMRFKYFRKFFCGNLTPLYGFLFGAEQCGPMIMPVNLLDRFTTIRARSAAVPLLGTHTEHPCESFSIWLRHSWPQRSRSGQREHWSR